MKSLLFNSTWACVTVATIAVYMLPVPFRPTLLLFLGIAHGRCMARYI